MDAETTYWVWAILLIAASVACWFATLLTLPGNWIVVVLVALFALFYPASDDGRGVSWLAVGLVVVLATIGELVEFAAGAAGAQREGGSKRGMVLAVVGTVVGSVLGLIVGLPVPLIGSLLAAVGGGALGAFVGAYAGETWKGRSSSESVAVGKGALVGRLLGTVGKLVVAAMIVVVVAAAVCF